jgi:hypothetical protein
VLTANSVYLVDPEIVEHAATPAPEPEKARSTSNTSCPACGAPVKDTFDIKCAFCGSPLNSTANDWVVSGLTERGDFRG